MVAQGVTSGDPRKVDKSGDTLTGDLISDDGSPLASTTYVAEHGGGSSTPSGTVTGQTAYGQTATPGTASAYSRGDHAHGTPALASTAPSTSAVGDAASIGTASTPARSDHVHGRELFGTAPATTLTIGTAAAAGTATSPARADHVHPTAAAGMPGSSAVGDTVSTGSATTPAASDHRHGREAFGAVTAQTAYGASSSNGTAATVARSDHAHGTPALTSSNPSTSAVGDASAVGTATAPARADHTHAREGFGPVVAQTSPGAASANGSATTVARSDHTHGTPAAPPALSRESAMLGLTAVTMAYTAPLSSGGVALTSGTMVAMLWRPGAVLVTNLGTWLTGAGVTSSGVNGMALYDAAGNLIDQTADMSALLATTPPAYVEAAVGTPRQLADATNYYVAILTHFSGTAPKVAGAVVSSNVPAIKGNAPSVAVSSQASFPASFNPATASKNNGAYFLGAS